MAGLERRYGRRVDTTAAEGASKDGSTLQAQRPFTADDATACEGPTSGAVKKTKITDFFYKNIESSLSLNVPMTPIESLRPRETKTARPSTQLYLDFGQKNLIATNCAECGMTFDPSFANDVRRHEKEHERLQTILQASTYGALCAWQELSRNGDLVLLIKSPGGHQVERLCRWINQLMGAVEQSVEELQRLDVYLQCRNERVVGFLSVERISDGVLISEYTGARHRVKALVGVSRIWTAPELRRQGVAMLLLKNLRQCAHANAIQCTDACLIPAIKVAFSQPTLAGKGLASSYLGLGAASCIYITYTLSEEKITE